MRLILPILLLLTCWTANAATVTGNLIDLFGENAGGTITFSNTLGAQIIGTSLNVSKPKSVALISGSFTNTLVTGNYLVTAGGHQFRINVPDSAATFRIEDLATNLVTYTYTNQPTFAVSAGTNVSISTNGGLVTINASANLSNATNNDAAIATGLTNQITANTVAIAGNATTIASHTTSIAGKLTAASNLSDLANAGTARTNLGAVARISGTASNLWLEQTTIQATNIFTGSGGLSATVGSTNFTGPANCFAGFKPGYNFVITNEQYLIVDINSSNNVTVFPSALRTYTSAPWTVYPNAVTYNDINQNRAGWIGNDGTVGIIGFLGNTFNSGNLVFANGGHSFVVDMANQADGRRLQFRTVASGGGSVFNIYNLAPYDSLNIRNDGIVSFRFGLTNFFGGPVICYSPMSVKGFMPALVKKTSSYPLTIYDHTVLLNGTTLTATLPTAVGVTGQQYTIKVISASTGTVATTSSQTIDASTTYSLSAQYKYVTVESDGANWFIVANN